MELVVRTLRMLSSVQAEALNLPSSLFRHCERCQFDHPEWLPDFWETLWTDSLILLHKCLGFFFTSQDHQSTSHVHYDFGILRRIGQGLTQDLFRLGRLLQGKTGQAHQVQDANVF